MRIIKVMADYYCFPLWEASPGKVGNIDPHTLPISKSLMNDLISWAQKYDSILNLDDPANSAFKSREEEIIFNEIGAMLAKKLQKELGENFTIVFFC